MKSHYFKMVSQKNLASLSFSKSREKGKSSAYHQGRKFQTGNVSNGRQ